MLNCDLNQKYLVFVFIFITAPQWLLQVWPNQCVIWSDSTVTNLNNRASSELNQYFTPMKTETEGLKCWSQKQELPTWTLGRWCLQMHLTSSLRNSKRSTSESLPLCHTALPSAVCLLGCLLIPSHLSDSKITLFAFPAISNWRLAMCKAPVCYWGSPCWTVFHLHS